MAQDAYGLQRTERTCSGFILCSFEPRPRIRECLTPRIYVEQRYLARCVAVRDLGLLPCSYNFLAQGKIACENILRARICTAVRTGAKRGTHFVTVYIGLRIVFSPYVRKLVGGGVIHLQFEVKKEWRQVNEKFFELKRDI